jgi:flavorubredoxin
MDTTTTEIADDIFRISTFVADAGLTFNQFVVKADEPLLFHTGLNALFPLVSDAVSRVLPLPTLRWVSFGHVEADECGSMNQWLRAAESAQVAFGALGCMVSVSDLAERPPHPLADGDTLDLGGKRVRSLATPHVPHGWEAGVLFEETTATLLCGDLFTQLGDGPAVLDDSPMERAIEGENTFGYSTLTPTSAPTIERLADCAPATLALMHGPTYTGDGRKSLLDLAADYRRRTDAALVAA